MPFFEGVYTAMVTPFDENLKVDLEVAQRLAHVLVENGSNGLVISGTTGESPTLRDQEKLALFRVVKDAVGERAEVIAGTGSNDTARSAELTEQVEGTGADGVMAVVPYYNRPPQEGLYRHFRRIAESTTLPVMLYNVPSRTACNLEPDTVMRLAEVPNIVAIKEAGGDFAAAANIVSSTPEDFTLLSGQDEWNLPLLCLGAAGFVSVASHVVGPQLREMLSAHRSGRNTEALALHNQMLPVFKALFVTTNPILVKEAMNLLGVKVGGLRPPLIEATAAQRQQLQAALSALGVEQPVFTR